MDRAIALEADGTIETAAGTLLDQDGIARGWQCGTARRRWLLAAFISGVSALMRTTRSAQHFEQRRCALRSQCEMFHLTQVSRAGARRS